MVFHWIYSHWCYYDYRLRSLSKIAWYLYSFAMVLLIGLELQVPGAVTIKGATAWYRLPGIGNFQPSEIMKLFLIIVIGRIIANHNEKYFSQTIHDDFYYLKNICNKFATTTTHRKGTRFRKYNGHFSDACSNDTSFWHTMAFYFRISFSYFRCWNYINIYFLLTQISLKHTF